MKRFLRSFRGVPRLDSQQLHGLLPARIYLTDGLQVWLTFLVRRLETADEQDLLAGAEIILGMVLMAFFYMMKLPFGMLTLLIGHTIFCVPYILMEVKARLAGMDPALEEAARDLGATPFRAFLDITLPLCMPAVLSGSLLAFAMSMDDVVISIFINGPKVSTLPIKVYTQIKTGVTPEINALCTIMLAATLLVLGIHALVKRINQGEKADEKQTH